jgi:hypothetical protein
MKITVDLEEVKLIAGKADKLLLEKGTEDELAKLLDLRDKIEEAINNAQKLIEQKGLSLNPNFKSVEGDIVKASYRAYGQKYYLEEDKIDQIPEVMFTKEVITKYKPDSEMIDIWIEKNGGLPYGIVAPVRPKSLKIALKKKNDDTKD